MNTLFYEDPTCLQELILDFEAKSIFDKDNFTDKERMIYNYLRDLNRIYETFSPTKSNASISVAILTCLPVSMPSIYGFNYHSKEYFILENALIKFFMDKGITEVWTDMSQGFSIAASKAVTRMKQHGFDIALKISIPYEDHGSRIFGSSKVLYDYIISKADEVLTSNDPQNNESYKKCVNGIIERADTLLCCDKKGKYNVPYVKFAQEKGKTVFDFDFDTLNLKQEVDKVAEER